MRLETFDKILCCGLPGSSLTGAAPRLDWDSEVEEGGTTMPSSWLRGVIHSFMSTQEEACVGHIYRKEGSIVPKDGDEPIEPSHLNQEPLLLLAPLLQGPAFGLGEVQGFVALDVRALGLGDQVA